MIAIWTREHKSTASREARERYKADVRYFKQGNGNNA